MLMHNFSLDFPSSPRHRGLAFVGCFGLFYDIGGCHGVQSQWRSIRHIRVFLLVRLKWDGLLQYYDVHTRCRCVSNNTRESD